MRKNTKILAVALVLIAVVCALPWKAVAGSFVALSEYAIRYIPSSTVPSNCTGGNVCAWVKSSDSNLYYRNATGTDVQITSGNTLAPAATSFPIMNSTSTVTLNSGVTMNGSATAYKSTTTNASTSGDIYWDFQDLTTSRLQLKFASIVPGSTALQTTSTTYFAIFDSGNNGLKITGGQSILRAGNAADILVCDGTGCFPNTTTLTMGKSGSEFGSVSSIQYRGVSAAPAFSATVAVNCTTAETQHIGTVNVNVTGATMTSGNVGQRCVVVWAKDASGTGYTITWSGSNVRATSAEAMSTAASSLFIQTFVWDDRLGTPAWVELSSKQTP